MKAYQKVLLAIGFLLLAIPTAQAQVAANVCTQTVTANGGTNCIPVSSSNPFPIAVFGGNNGQCFVSNGVKGVFTTCPGGSSISLTTSGTSGASTLVGSVLNIPVYSGGGGGSVSVTAGTPNVVITPTPGTTTFTVGLTDTTTAQGSTTPYTVTAANMGQTITHSSASALAEVLPSAAATGFTAGSSYTELNLGAGALTVTTSSGTINGNSTQILHKFGWQYPVSDGTNWNSLVFPGFGTITTNAITKFIDASGAVTASGLTDDGTTISTSENLALSSTVTVTNLSVTGTCTGCGGGGGGSPGGPVQALQYNAGASTFGGATGLFVSTTRSGIDFLASVTTSNLISIGAHGTDTTSFAIGASALLSQTATGSNNIAIGLGALTTATTAINSVAIGTNAGAKLATGNQDVFVGVSAGASEVGSSNTAVGYQAMNANSNSSNNASFGTQNMLSCTGGSNTSYGAGSMSGNPCSGSNNVAVGFNAGQGIQSGGNNTVLGYEAGQGKISTGSNNVVIGALVGTTNLTSGSSNILIGNSAQVDTSLSSTSTAIAIGGKAGTFDTSVGFQALSGTTTNANQNTALGYQAGKTITTGLNNLVLGALAGTTTLATGSDNTLIGGLADTTTPGASHEFHLHDASLAAGTDAVTITGMGTNTTQAVTIHGLTSLSDIGTDATHTDASVCEDTTTHTLYSGSGTLGVCLGTSSMRYKHDINHLPLGLAELAALKPVSFYYNKGRGDNGVKLQYGFLAEDMEGVLPNLVDLDKDGKPNSVDLVGLIPVLVHAIQEQQKEIDALKAKKK
jgi:hypothetical protein